VNNPPEESPLTPENDKIGRAGIGSIVVAGKQHQLPRRQSAACRGRRPSEPDCTAACNFTRQCVAGSAATDRQNRKILVPAACSLK